MVARKPAMSAESLVRPRSGLATARTTYPSRCSRSISPLQLAALAQAPCTRTIVGFTAHRAVGVGAASETGEDDTFRAAEAATTPKIMRTTDTAITAAATYGPRRPLNGFIRVPPWSSAVRLRCMSQHRTWEHQAPQRQDFRRCLPECGGG